VGKSNENRPSSFHGGGSQIDLCSGLSNLELWLAAEQARERPSLAWSVCQLEQAIAFCLEQEGFLFGFEFGQSQFHPVHFAPLSFLERVSLGGEISMDCGCRWRV
jgi:hypothetical protein